MNALNDINALMLLGTLNACVYVYVLIQLNALNACRYVCYKDQYLYFNEYLII